MAKKSKGYIHCGEASPLILEVHIKHFRLLKKIINEYPHAELIVKTQDGIPVLVEGKIKDNLSK